MFLPLGFLVGIAILLLAPDVLQVLPGSGDEMAAVFAAPLLLLPAALAALAGRWLRQDVARGRLASRRVFSMLRVLPPLVPATLLAWQQCTNWSDLAERWGGTSHVATMACLLAPLIAMECARLVAETPTRERLDELGHGAGALPLRRRLGMVVFVIVPWLAFAAMGDLAAVAPRIAAFCLATGIGRSLCAIAAGLSLAVVLPLAFRWTAGLSRALPPALEQPLGDTVAALGFSRRSLRVMDTGRRLPNALLLGVLPWPRYVVITDALLGMLDLFALRGVVAHEVGHARAGHLAMFLGTAMLVLPLGAGVAQQLDLFEYDPTRLVIVGVVAMAVLVFVVHRVAHRFEHEADVLSAVALGGAAPCIRALQAAGQFSDHVVTRASFLHPAEQRRIEVLLAWETDPAFRARFARRGRRLRVGVAGLLAVVMLGGVWSWWDAWPTDRAWLRFRLGEFATARADIQAAAGSVRSGQWKLWQYFSEDVEAALTVAGSQLDSPEAATRMADECWRRGVGLLVTQGAIAARPFVSMATWNGGSPLQRSVDLYCYAVAEADQELQQRVAEHIRALGCPPELASVFGS